MNRAECEARERAGLALRIEYDHPKRGTTEVRFVDSGTIWHGTSEAHHSGEPPQWYLRVFCLERESFRMFPLRRVRFVLD